MTFQGCDGSRIAGQSNARVWSPGQIAFATRPKVLAPTKFAGRAPACSTQRTRHNNNVINKIGRLPPAVESPTHTLYSRETCQCDAVWTRGMLATTQLGTATATGRKENSAHRRAADPRSLTGNAPRQRDPDQAQVHHQKTQADTPRARGLGVVMPEWWLAWPFSAGLACDTFSPYAQNLSS